MKKPRINDFYPNATETPSLSSSMENLPAIEKSALPPTMQEKGDDRSREFIPSPQKDHDTVIPRYHDTMQPRYHATTDTSPKNELIETVRKSVKRIGKEAATHRFTLEEK